MPAPSQAEESDIHCAIIAVENGAKIQSADICCKGQIAGKVHKRNGFITLKSMQKTAKKKKKLAQQKKLKRLMKSAKNYCKQVVEHRPTQTPTPVGTAQPTPNSTPQPTPISSPTPTGELNFDENTNVTETGKECFKIPSYLQANANRGTLAVDRACTGCHGTHLFTIPEATLYDRDFAYVSQRIREAPMSITEDWVNENDVADIVAFLNRFRIDNCN